ncbi:hypothetical protein ACLOJK_007623 [Asimina triloba]
MSLLLHRAVYIRRKYGNRQLSSSIYLSEAEPFLEQYAKRSAENRALIGSAGNLVKSEDFMAIVEGGRDEEGDLDPQGAAVPTTPSHSIVDRVPKAEGLIVFFPGIPGCAKSALCKELLSAPGGLGDDRPLTYPGENGGKAVYASLSPNPGLLGLRPVDEWKKELPPVPISRIIGRYWQRVADERRRKPNFITLADKNAPNEEVWRQLHIDQDILVSQIEDMCRSTRASAVPIVPDSEAAVIIFNANVNEESCIHVMILTLHIMITSYPNIKQMARTDSNPFSLDALAVFIFRVLQRVNHPGNLDKASPNVGYVLLMFYHLYEGKNRREFESELSERFGSLVKMPLLKNDRLGHSLYTIC